MSTIQKVTLTEAIIKEILNRMRVGSLKPGDRLPPEKELAQEFNVSRPVVREALRSLATMNVLKIRAGSGAVIRDVQEAGVINADLLELVLERGQELRQLHEARVLVEGALAAWAAERAGEEDWARLEESLERLRQASTPSETYELAREFHAAIAQASQNPILTQLFAPLYDTMLEHLMRRGRPLFSLEGEYDIHRELLDDIRSRDPERARQAMHRHLELSFLRWFKDDDQTPED